MKKIIAVLMIVGSLVPVVNAEEKGAMLYSIEKRDLSLPLSEHISNQSKGMILKRVVYREVLAKGEGKTDVTVALFTVKRRTNKSQLAFAENLIRQ